MKEYILKIKNSDSKLVVVPDEMTIDQLVEKMYERRLTIQDIVLPKAYKGTPVSEIIYLQDSEKNLKEETFDYVVFLDIESMLKKQAYKDGFTFEKESVEFLNKLSALYNIQIVLSSSWRHAFSFAYMQKLLKINGIKAPLIDRIYIVTSYHKELRNISIPDHYSFDKSNINNRDNEIAYWIMMFKPNHYLILDDYQCSIIDLEFHRITRMCAFEKGGCVNMDDLDTSRKILDMPTEKILLEG